MIDRIGDAVTGGVAGLFKNHKIDQIDGEGSLTADGNVKVREIFTTLKHYGKSKNVLVFKTF